MFRLYEPLSLCYDTSLPAHPLESIEHKVKYRIGAIRRAKPYVDSNTLQTISQALIQPHFDYYSTLLRNCSKLL